MKGIIYFIQPVELVGTNRYKIGCSKSPDLDRCKNGYKKGSRYLCIMECDNPTVLEKKIIDEFNKQFIKIAGNEYFEGEENIMLNLFLELFNNHKNINISNDNTENESLISNNSNDEIIYEISTYEDYLLTSRIEKIIITNKKLKEGILKFNKPSDCWYKIYNNDEYGNEGELLFEWLETNAYKINCALDKITNKLCRKNYNKLWTDKDYSDKYTNCEIEFNYPKIINDICKKCYNKDVNIYNLKEYEYFIRTDEYKMIIFDTKNLKIMDYANEINNKILTNFDSSVYTVYFNNFENINITIVENILKVLINNDIIEYKKICYNIIVEQKENIIFYDNTKYNLLSDWIANLLDKIIADYKYYDYDINDTNKNIIKNIIKNKPKVIFIGRHSPYMADTQIKKAIKQVKNLGIKNIIVCDNKKLSNNKLHSKYIKYITDNKDIIIDNAYDKTEMEEKLPNNIKNRYDDHYDAVFDRTKLLFMNYLKWCCFNN